jgi:hypothetical protein
VLGTIVARGAETRKGVGGRRMSIRVKAINGDTYSGILFLDAGDYVRLTRIKKATPGIEVAKRPNPISTGAKMVIGGLAIAGTAAVLLAGRSASANPTTPALPGPQPPSNEPTTPPPETEVVITAPPAGSPPDAPPVEHVEPTNGSAPAPEPAIVVPPPAPTRTPPAPTTQPPVAGTAPHASLVQRLSTSDAARQIFVFQALCYEWSVSGNVPDGLLGPLTAGLIRSIDLQSSISPPSGNFRGATTIRRLTDVVMRSNGGALPTPRVLPFTLPRSVISRSVISQVNATGTRIGSPILLQIGVG